MRPLLLAALAAGCGAPPEATDGSVADLSAATTDFGAPADAAAADLAPGCPPGMAYVPLADGAVCIDRYEAAVVQVLPDGDEAPWSYYDTVDGKTVRAIVADGIKPQGYVSEVQAQAACQLSQKRLCTLPEWLAACQGPAGTTYPYGNTYISGACNEGRSTNPVNDCFGGGNVFTYQNMNSPCCDQQPNTVAPGGSFPKCVSAYGVYDLHGNLHEWVDATSNTGNGIFKGGFFVDAKINGAGCKYTTSAHAKTYHDYSTGFRCCAAPR
jgi:sulfatase modifying factor 1